MIRKLVCLFCCGLMMACEKNHLGHHPELLVLGHGGMGLQHQLPLNSYESVEKCLFLNVDGTEVDIQMTADSILIVFHDENLKDATHFSGKVHEMRWSEIEGAAYRFPIYGQYRVIQLDDLLTRLEEKKKKLLFLDCKPFSEETSMAFSQRFNEAISSVLKKHEIAENVFLQLGREDMIFDMKQRRPDLKIIAGNQYDEAIKMAERYQLHGIVIQQGQLNTERVTAAKNLNLKIFEFGISNKEEIKDAIKLGVDCIISDELKKTIRILNR